MPETLESLVKQAIAAAQQEDDLPEFTVTDYCMERPADTTNGDWSSTVAMRSARLARMAPAKIAAAIVAHMPASDAIAKCEVAGPGFINFYLSTSANNEVFRSVREAGDDWGKVNVGNGLKFNYEFISANPTGSLHVGHGRWAALGDSVCNVLEHTNHEVTREYYINDHGSQMDVFGRSVATRYLQLVEIMRGKGLSPDDAVAYLLQDRDRYVEDEQDEHPRQHLRCRQRRKYTLYRYGAYRRAVSERLHKRAGADGISKGHRAVEADRGSPVVCAQEPHHTSRFGSKSFCP